MKTLLRLIQPTDLPFFSALAAAGSMSAAARELGITPAAVSKHLALMESRLGIALVNRTSRRMSLTQEGELYLERARAIVGEIDAMEDLLTESRVAPHGLLRVNATLGFGRAHVAPLISRFVRKHGQIQLQLQLSVAPPPLAEDLYDVCVRFGPPPDTRLISRFIAPNRRVLCASPAYLARRGTPSHPADLSQHDCIGIRQGDETFGVWRLTSGAEGATKVESIKVRGSLATNDGEIAVNWALDGHGILLRAEWDVERYLRNGRLVQVLPLHRTPDADIHATWPERHRHTTRVRAFVDFLALSLDARRETAK